jgi:hypothetical protein
MKQIFLALMITASSSHALIIAEQQNNANGLMVLTDEICENNTGRVAYSTIPNTETLLGCWNYDDNFVHIYWAQTRKLVSYPINSWKMKVKAKSNGI